MPESEKPQQLDGEEDEAYWERREEWENDTRAVVQLEPEEFLAEAENTIAPINLFEQYSKEGLQVIVKLANIELSPEKPEYPGGSWHVEGQLVRSISTCT